MLTANRITTALRTKLFAVFVVSACLPAVLVTAVSFYWSRDALSTIVQSNLETAAAENMGRLEEFLTRASVQLKGMSGLPSVRRIPIADGMADAQGELAQLSRDGLFFSNLLVVDLDGTIIADGLNREVGRPFAHRSVLVSVLEGEEYRSEVVKTRLLEGVSRQSAPGRRSGTGLGMIYGTPLRSVDANVVGALVGVLDWNLLQQKLSAAQVAGQRQTATRFLILKNARGEMLYRTPALKPVVARQFSVLRGRLETHERAGWPGRGVIPSGCRKPSWTASCGPRPPGATITGIICVTEAI